MNTRLGRHKPRRYLIPLLCAGLIAGLSGLSTGPGAAASPVERAAAQAPSPAPVASGFLFYKLISPQPTCAGFGLNVSAGPNYSRDDCGFALFVLSETVDAANVKAELYGSDGVKFKTLDVVVSDAATKEYEVSLEPDETWTPGEIRMVITANGEPVGETHFGHNLLAATIAAAPGAYKPGDPIPVTGEVNKLDSESNLAGDESVPTRDDAPEAKFDLKLVSPEGIETQIENVTTDSTGAFSTTIPGSVTENISAGPETNYEITLAIAAVNATYDDPDTGEWAAKRAGSGAVTLKDAPTGLVLENSFVSAVGWVKPGERYPSRVFVRNFTDQVFNDVSVEVTVPASTSVLEVDPGNDSGTATNTDTTITWNVGTVAAAPANGQTIKTLVIESEADTLAEDPKLVWKDLSSTAVMTVGGTEQDTDVSHGPRVIPPAETYDTARYGDRPFPVVPVDYLERKHLASNSGDELAGKINSSTIPGSTFNLFQEMSLGQLFPNGTVPSSGIASRGFEYEPGFDFTTVKPNGVCRGTTVPADTAGSPLYPERIRDGFYQLPGNTEYYGSDKFGSALVGAEAGVGPLFDIDSACGPTGKLVYDSAAIADPEIDYSDYDTDKDGVVDFFMVVFAGCGGNGASQTGCGGEYSDAPYDNVWPHSSSLEFYYTDTKTGQSGYVSDDQLKNLKGEKLYYTDASRGQMTTDVTDFPVFVRVGPYNVNPEDSIDNASVISHEYGHSLGLPDFYSLGSRTTYGDWNLMATDKSQNMDIFSRQEMGWVVPEVLKPGTAPRVDDWTDSKEDTHTIKWQTADGDPYVLRGPRVHNAQAYVAKLPGRQLIDPAKFDTGDKASKSHAWWSGAGNDFGCSPDGGHNLDVVVPGVQDLPEGSTVQLDFKSLWDIEWDYDYGFVLTSNNGGQQYISHASENGYTTPATQNPRANSCQARYGNGITGSSGSYQDGTQEVDRVTDTYPESVFLADSYDVTDLTLGEDEEGVIRFSYSTDPGAVRPGWFIDDIKVTATLPNGSKQVLLETDLEDDSEGGPDAPSFFPGGCKDDTTVATECTPGWNYISASAGSDADHAYYMELRDRSGFDASGKGENDRDPIDFAPGLSLVYTDEANGYGNTGGGNPPPQSPLDSQPEPGDATPLLADAAWTAAADDDVFSDFGEGHVDNYTDPSETQAEGSVANPWRFAYDCLSFDVARMVGDDIGPEENEINPAGGNLEADVNFTMGNGCGVFDYGYLEEDGGGEPPGNLAPVANAVVKPQVGPQSRRFTFDATGSTDAETPNDLDFVWDFGDGGVKKDAVGPLVRHRFAEPGVYRATVTVTDPRGKTDVDTVIVTVTQTVQCAQEPVQKLGGWRHLHSREAQRGHYCVNDKDKTTEGDSLALAFQGPRLDLRFGKRNDGGSAVVLIDGKRQGTISFYRSGGGAKPTFGFIRQFRDLGKGWHTIRLVVAPPKRGNRFAIVDSFTFAGQARKPR